MATARIDKQSWIRCPNCGHKLGRAVGSWENIGAFPAIEIKCHSCKEVTYVMVGKREARDDQRD